MFCLENVCFFSSVMNSPGINEVVIREYMLEPWLPVNYMSVPITWWLLYRQTFLLSISVFLPILPSAGSRTLPTTCRCCQTPRHITSSAYCLLFLPHRTHCQRSWLSYRWINCVCVCVCSFALPVGLWITNQSVVTHLSNAAFPLGVMHYKSKEFICMQRYYYSSFCFNTSGLRVIVMIMRLCWLEFSLFICGDGVEKYMCFYLYIFRVRVLNA